VPNKFAIFSTELGPMTEPADEYDNLTAYVLFDSDPIGKGSYNPNAGSTMRGSVIPTLGGTVVQDFGPQIQDQRIEISDEAAFSSDTVDAIKAMYETASGEYYFTDGYNCWLVYFSRPDGFWYKRNLISSHYGVARFDYEIRLVVIAEEI
jgi:hypothetical protein